MKKVFSEFTSKCKGLIGKISQNSRIKHIVTVALVCLIIASLIVFSALSRQNDTDPEINLSNTSGMDFSFDKEDISTDTIDDYGTIFDFSDNESTAESTEPVETDRDKEDETSGDATETKDATENDEPADDTASSSSDLTDSKGNDAPDTSASSQNSSSSSNNKKPAASSTASNKNNHGSSEPETSGNTSNKNEHDSVTTLSANSDSSSTTAPKKEQSQISGGSVSADTTAATTQKETEPVETEPDDSEALNITTGGTYTISGTKKDTTIVIDTGEGDVQLILNGAVLNNSKGPAIYVRSAGKVQITLAAGTTNTISDGASYYVTDNSSTLDAAIFCKADLTVNGSGSLTLNGNYKHGIVSKDDLVISSGTLNITSKNVALTGKDCVKINSGNITINAGSDGIRSDNITDSAKGYIYLYGGNLNITSANDGVQAATVLKIENVDLSVKAGGGSAATAPSASAASFKGLKAGSDILISGGVFKIDSRDDCIHSNATVTVSGGTYTLSSGDDGVHADTDIAISGSTTTLNISKCYEGIEATSVLISGGTISLYCSDDGINAAGGNDSSQVPGARPGNDNFTSSDGKVSVSGGTLYINSMADGIDANGILSVTGGSVTISCPDNGDTAILDFDGSGTISGGTFIGTGASGMSQNFSTLSTQGVIMLKTAPQAAGTVIQLSDKDANVIATHTADQPFSCVIISHASIVKGNTYTLIVGSESTQITMTDTVYGSGGRSGSPIGKS